MRPWMQPIAQVADRRIGGSVSAAVCRHHRRRLERLGKAALLTQSGGWATDSPRPRAGNRLEVLIDGEAALGRMVDELARATTSVYVSGWFLSPDFVMRDGTDPVVVRNLLAGLSARLDVRVLLWAGAPVPVFRPSRREVRKVRDELRRAGIRCELDAHERPLHCHHEKTIVVDGRLAFVGGIDLTAKAGDRRDSQRHHARADVGWHDVAAVVEGPVVGDVARHFALRWHGVTGERVPAAPDPEPAGGSTVQLVRTVPEGTYPGADHGAFGILETYLRAIRSARELVYLESQYLWSPEIVRLLAEKLRRPPSDRFRVMIVLPGRPYGGADDTRGALAELVAADGGSRRMLACALYAPAGRIADLIYVHAKLGVIDDRLLIVGSANLNDHSLFNDTEAALVTDDAELAARTRRRLWAEHLECSEDEVDGDPAHIIDTRLWPRAEEQAALRRRGEPMTARLSRLEGVSRHSDRLLGPVEGLLIDG